MDGARNLVGTPNPPANADGWNSTDVTVTFTADDALSGVDVIDPPVTLTVEGAGQEAIGTATDKAGNTCLLWPPNRQLVTIASVGASDGLSGLSPGSLVVGATSSESDSGKSGAHAGDIVVVGATVQVRAVRDGGGSGRTYTVTASVRDAAGNAATQSGTCFVPHDRGRR